jgi:hypothetical protein
LPMTLPRPPFSRPADMASRRMRPDKADPLT